MVERKWRVDASHTLTYIYITDMSLLRPLLQLLHFYVPRTLSSFSLHLNLSIFFSLSLVVCLAGGGTEPIGSAEAER